MGEPRVDPVGAEGIEEFVDLAGALRAGDADYVPPFRALDRRRGRGAAGPAERSSRSSPGAARARWGEWRRSFTRGWSTRTGGRSARSGSTSAPTTRRGGGPPGGGLGWLRARGARAPSAR